MLNYYSWHSELVKRNGNLNFVTFAIMRFVRTTPLILATLLMIFAFPASLGSGPTFERTLANVTNNCELNGWRELLYISNLYPANEICLPHGWFMAADFQLYIISFFLIILMYKRPKVGITLTCATVGVGFVIQMVVVAYVQTMPYFRMDVLDSNLAVSQTHLLHFSTLQYVSSYFIGLMVGFLIANMMELKSNLAIVLMQIAFPVLTAIAVLLPGLAGDDLSGPLFYLIGPITRTLLSMSVAGMVYLCWLGRGGDMCRVLSSTLFARLGRFSFSTFMVHYLLIWYEASISRSPYDLTPYPMVLRIIASLTVSQVLGYFVFLIFEAPAFNITKALLTKNRKGHLIEERKKST